MSSTLPPCSRAIRKMYDEVDAFFFLSFCFILFNFFFFTNRLLSVALGRLLSGALLFQARASSHAQLQFDFHAGAHYFVSISVFYLLFCIYIKISIAFCSVKKVFLFLFSAPICNCVVVQVELVVNRFPVTLTNAPFPIFYGFLYVLFAWTYVHFSGVFYYFFSQLSRSQGSLVSPWLICPHVR